MFVVVAAISSCVSGVTTCNDYGPPLYTTISLVVIVALVVGVAVLVNRGTRE